MTRRRSVTYNGASMTSVKPAFVAAGAAGLAGLRWALQGGGTVYTDFSRGSYVPDPEAGWRFVAEGPIWLGLDTIAVLSGLAVVLAAVGYWTAKRDSSPWVGVALWVAAAASGVVPLLAFSSGSLPEGAQLTRPTATVQAPTSGITASLEGLAAGRYDVASEHPATSVVATVSAGGEAFETRFTGISGHMTGNPGDLTQPLQIEIRLDATTVDTGVELRSEHARDYLKTDAHPTITVTTPGLSATERSADGTLTFAAQGSLALMGDTIDVAITGTLEVLDQTQRATRKVSATHAVLVSASFAVAIADTGLRSDASDFSAETIPIQVSALLTATND